MIKSLSLSIAKYIVKTENDADLEILAYGYELILQEIVVIIVSICLAAPFGIVPHILLSSVLYDLMRSVAGGLHASNRIACILTSVLIIFGPALIFTRSGVVFPAGWIVPLFALSFILIMRYAPADTDIRPVTDAIKKRTMKRSAVTILAIAFLLACATYPYSSAFSAVFAFIPAMVGLLLHPASYRVFGCRKSDINTRQEEDKT